MSIALPTDVDLPTALRAVAAERAATALERLRSVVDVPADVVDEQAEDGWDRAVHDARKRCKEVRAIARLARGGLGRKASRASNAAFRDAARILGPARDGWTLVATVDAIRADPAIEADEGALDAARAALLERYRLVRQQAQAERWVERTITALEGAAAVVAAWALPADLGPEGLRDGIERASGRARDRWAEIAGTVGEDPQASSHGWHECRKRVKDCWYHVQLLEPSWPRVLGAYESELDELADLFGLDHDLGVLVDALQGTGEHVGDPVVDPVAAELVAAATVARRHGLRARAAALAPLLLAEPADAYADRLIACAAAVDRWSTTAA